MFTIAGRRFSPPITSPFLGKLWLSVSSVRNERSIQRKLNTERKFGKKSWIFFVFHCKTMFKRCLRCTVRRCFTGKMGKNRDKKVRMNYQKFQHVFFFWSYRNFSLQMFTFAFGISSRKYSIRTRCVLIYHSCKRFYFRLSYQKICKSKPVLIAKKRKVSNALQVLNSKRP